MGVLPCSGACPVGGSDVREDGGRFVEGFPALEGVSNEDTYLEYDIDGQTLSCYSNHSEDGNFEETDHFAEPCHHQEGTSHFEIKLLEQDEPQAVWVKRRGRWESGIRCARDDWPLSSLKARPTHDGKQYLVIFSPRTRNYSWEDVLLVRPINEFPNPIAHETHQIGVKMVADLALARRFIMQKLAVGMLNILDKLNREALVESARDVMLLKDFAMEASNCKDYSDLGMMLLKLQKMILLHYLTSDWLHKSLVSWKQRCHAAISAECVEMLKEELADSILWNEVDLSSAARQVDEGSDWKSWKHEVMKLFSVLHPMSTVVGLDKAVKDISLTTELQTPEKRLKLDAPHDDTHHSILVETNASFSNGGVNLALLDADTIKRNSPVDDAVLAGSTRVFVNSAKAKVAPPTDSPMCGGTTFRGTKCKHRALGCSSFCKKHRPRDGKDIDSPVNKRKRKGEDTSSTILVLSREDEIPARQEAVSIIKCKICSTTLLDNKALGEHWTDSHKEEGQLLFRGYGCAVCLESFTDRKVLEAHVQQKHHMQFAEDYMLLQCILCDCHFGNPEELWLHVLSAHPSSLSMSNAAAQPSDNSSRQIIEANKSDFVEHTEPDNHAAHTGDQNSGGPRQTRPGFKEALSSASYKIIRKRSVQNLKNRIQTASSTVPDAATLGGLTDSQCSAIAEILISEINKTKLQPHNSEILSIASSACCKVSLQASLEEKYGIMHERLYLKAAKLCSQHNSVAEWHQDGYICPKGCSQSVESPILSPLVPSSDDSFKVLETEKCTDRGQNETQISFGPMDEKEYAG